MANMLSSVIPDAILKWRHKKSPRVKLTKPIMLRQRQDLPHTPGGRDLSAYYYIFWAWSALSVFLLKKAIKTVKMRLSLAPYSPVILIKPFNRWSSQALFLSLGFYRCLDSLKLRGLWFMAPSGQGSRKWLCIFWITFELKAILQSFMTKNAP